MSEWNPAFDVVIIGGLGHVGLPLGISLALAGKKTCLYDLNEAHAKLVLEGKMPFIEYGAEEALKEALARSMLFVSNDPTFVGNAKFVIIAIGTPVDEYMNPKTRQFLEILHGLKKHMNPAQIVVVRSTVYPHTCQQLLNTFNDDGGDWQIAYCPERIIQGYSMRELKELPQLVAGFSDTAIRESMALFSALSPKVIEVSIGEAELAKLFSNAWRYIQFAITNQFYMISHNLGVDYNKVRQAMRDGYKRAESLPTAGFTAGPCLLKDTMQLAAFNTTNGFLLGHAAMMVNEGLPNFIVEDLRNRYNLRQTKIGILGMSFKADIDDVRDSLSFKLGKILRFHGAQVLYSDEFAANPDFVTKEELISRSDVVIVAVPHTAYKGLAIPKAKEVVDLWGIVRQE